MVTARGGNAGWVRDLVQIYLCSELSRTDSDADSSVLKLGRETPALSGRYFSCSLSPPRDPSFAAFPSIDTFEPDCGN